MGINEFILYSYPFIIIGALSSALACSIAVFKTRLNHYVLWWLMVGIVVNMLALAGENILFLAARYHYIDLTIKEATYHWVLPVLKSMYAFATWFHFWGAVAALRSWHENVIKFWLMLGTILYISVFIAMIFLSIGGHNVM